jgi:hypothetical protein
MAVSAVVGEPADTAWGFGEDNLHSIQNRLSGLSLCLSDMRMQC